MIVTTGPKTSSHDTLASARRSGDHRRLDHDSASLAAGEHLGAEPAGLLDPLEDPLSRIRVDHRADVRLLIGGIADDELLHMRDEAA